MINRFLRSGLILHVGTALSVFLGFACSASGQELSEPSIDRAYETGKIRQVEFDDGEMALVYEALDTSPGDPNYILIEGSYTDYDGRRAGDVVSVIPAPEYTHGKYCVVAPKLMNVRFESGQLTIHPYNVFSQRHVWLPQQPADCGFSTLQDMYAKSVVAPNDVALDTVGLVLEQKGILFTAICNLDGFVGENTCGSMLLGMILHSEVYDSNAHLCATAGQMGKEEIYQACFKIDAGEVAVLSADHFVYKRAGTY